MGTIEQRGAVRHEVAVAAEVYTTNSVLAASTKNLSSTGVCLEVEKGLQENSVVGVSLFFTEDGIEDPDVEPLNLKATVIWCTDTEDERFIAGARFEEIDGEQQTQLDGYLEALEEK